MTKEEFIKKCSIRKKHLRPADIDIRHELDVDLYADYYFLASTFWDHNSRFFLWEDFEPANIIDQILFYDEAMNRR